MAELKALINSDWVSSERDIMAEQSQISQKKGTICAYRNTYNFVYNLEQNLIFIMS